MKSLKTKQKSKLIKLINILKLRKATKKNVLFVILRSKSNFISTTFIEFPTLLAMPRAKPTQWEARRIGSAAGGGGRPLARRQPIETRPVAGLRAPRQRHPRRLRPAPRQPPPTGSIRNASVSVHYQVVRLMVLFGPALF